MMLGGLLSLPGPDPTRPGALLPLGSRPILGNCEMMGRMSAMEFSVGFRRKGRPRLASDAIQMNNYKDESNQYAMVAGLKPWHERVVDTMIANPSANIVYLAEVFSVTPQWMGALLRSDAFKQYYAERMHEHRKMIDATVVNKLAGIAEKALDKISSKLDADKELTFGQAKDAADIALRGLGYLGQGSHVNVNVNGPGQVTNNAVYVTADALEVAREKLKNHMANSNAVTQQGAYTHVTSSLERPEGIDDAITVPYTSDE